jgi:hypothetical protein
MLKEYINSKRQTSASAIMDMEKHLSNYFSSDPYNEVQAFLENNTSIPHLNTKESHDSSLINPEKVENLKKSKEKKLLGSGREESVERGLQVVRDQIRRFLDRDSKSPTAKVIKYISNAYES